MIVVVKKEDELDVTEGTDSWYLSLEDVPAQEALLQERKMLWRVYAEDFLYMHQANEPQGVEDPGKSGELLLCSPEYNSTVSRSLEATNMMCFTRTNWNHVVALRNKERKEGKNISFVLPYNLHLRGGAFEVARKRWRAVLQKLIGFQLSRSRYSTVVSTVPICKTHDWNSCATKT